MSDLISRQAVLDEIDKRFDLAKSFKQLIKSMPPVKQEPCADCISRQAAIDEIEFFQINPQHFDFVSLIDNIKALPPVKPEPKWIPVSERLPELNRPLLVTSYGRVCYAYMISESGNWGYPVFRLHEMCGRSWVQETVSHEPYSAGRIDAWMYLDIPEPYKMCGGEE